MEALYSDDMTMENHMAGSSGVVHVEPVGDVDVYAVGLLADLRMVRTRLAVDGFRLSSFAPIRHTLSSVVYSFSKFNFRAIRNHLLTGYIAEPVEWPGGLKRAGSGWTRRRSIRSLLRHHGRAVVGQR